MAAPVVAVALMQAAKMAVNIGQAIKGLSDADKAMESARRQAEQLTELNAMRAYSSAMQTRDLIGEQRAALAQSGFASSSAAVAAGNRALVALSLELRADQIETNQRITELYEQAAQIKAQARQRLIGVAINEPIDATSQILPSAIGAKDRSVGGKEISGKTKIDLKPPLSLEEK